MQCLHVGLKQAPVIILFLGPGCQHRNTVLTVFIVCYCSWFYTQSFQIILFLAAYYDFNVGLSYKLQPHFPPVVSLLSTCQNYKFESILNLRTISFCKLQILHLERFPNCSDHIISLTCNIFQYQALIRKYAPVAIVIGVVLMLFWLKNKIW